MKNNSEKQIAMNKNTLTIGKAFTQHGRINKTNSVSLDPSDLYTQVPFHVVHSRDKKKRLILPSPASSENCFFIHFYFFAIIHSKRDQNESISFSSLNVSGTS